MLEPLGPQNKQLDRIYDICVIGAGAAGISVATDLAQKGRSVFLAEAGEMQYSIKSQDHYKGDLIGDPYFDLMTARLRFFGGTTGHWGGWCRELDPYDFEAKSACSMAAWPITYEDLRSYSAPAAAILKVPQQSPDRPLNTDFNEIFFEFSPPVRFGQEFKDEISSSSNIDALTSCNLQGFQFDGTRIEKADFTNYSGLKVTIRAKHFVLACGGIENSRILLIENEKFGNKLGNSNGLVGRYWAEHNTFTIGDFLLFEDDAFITKALVAPSGTESRRIFVGPSKHFLEREKVLNCGLRLIPLYKRTGAKKHLANILCRNPNLSNMLLERFGKRLVCGGEIRASWEQIPNIDNRVVLSNEKDNFGLQRCELHWRKTNRDKLAPRMSALGLGRYLAEKDIGRIKLASWLLQDDDEFPTDDEIVGYHHMGGTRMAKSKRDGVVDSNCRVFGTSNLHIAGSSVFPSSGHANPTFTIIQLAFRLSEHLSVIL